MIEVVNEEGVDINRYLVTNKPPATLQFVCGLGPRKATALVTRIRTKTGILETRGDLVREASLGNVIFMNCASFIRVNPDHVNLRRRSVIVDVLDDTRIHPEDYAIARKMAADAIEEEQAIDDDDNPSHQVEEVMRNPERLEELLLEDFAAELERSKGESKRMALETIRTELMHPYRDTRVPFRAPDENEVFTMLTGETDETIYPGGLVGATVVRIHDMRIGVRLDSGLEGIVSIKNVGDYGPDALREGQAVKCSILRVFKDKFLLDLSMRESDLGMASGSGHVRKDRYFDLAAEEDENARHRCRSLLLDAVVDVSDKAAQQVLHGARREASAISKLHVSRCAKYAGVTRARQHHYPPVHVERQRSFGCHVEGCRRRLPARQHSRIGQGFGYWHWKALAYRQSNLFRLG
jgi:transcription elongation factor SPT6